MEPCMEPWNIDTQIASYSWATKGSEVLYRNRRRHELNHVQFCILEERVYPEKCIAPSHLLVATFSKKPMIQIQFPACGSLLALNDNAPYFACVFS